MSRVFDCQVAKYARQIHRVTVTPELAAGLKSLIHDEAAQRLNVNRSITEQILISLY